MPTTSPRSAGRRPTAGSSIGVLVDVNLGMNRTGVPTAEAARRAGPARLHDPGPAIRRADGLRRAHADDPGSGREARGRRRGDRQTAARPRRRPGRRHGLPDHLGRRLRQLSVHRRFPRDHRAPGRRRHLRLPVLYPALPRRGPPTRDLRPGHRRQPARTRPRDPRHRPQVRQPAQDAAGPSRSSRLSDLRPLRRARRGRRRDRIRACESGTRCTSSPVTAISPSCSTIGCWPIEAAAWWPSGTCSGAGSSNEGLRAGRLGAEGGLGGHGWRELGPHERRGSVECSEPVRGGLGCVA